MYKPPQVEISLSGSRKLVFDHATDTFLNFNFDEGWGFSIYASRSYAGVDGPVVLAQPDFPEANVWVYALYTIPPELIEAQLRDGETIGESRRSYRVKYKDKGTWLYLPLHLVKEVKLSTRGTEREVDRTNLVRGYWYDFSSIRDYMPHLHSEWLETALQKLEQTTVWVKELLTTLDENPLTKPYYERVKTVHS